MAVCFFKKNPCVCVCVCMGLCVFILQLNFLFCWNFFIIQSWKKLTLKTFSFSKAPSLNKPAKLNKMRSPGNLHRRVSSLPHCEVLSLSWLLTTYFSSRVQNEDKSKQLSSHCSVLQTEQGGTDEMATSYIYQFSATHCASVNNIVHL